jgi:HlyD family secretion protein
MAWRMTWKPAAALIAAGLIVCGGGLWWFTHRAPAASYVTAPVTRGDVVTTITASGTINPQVTVQVGTFVSGVIDKLACDYNTKVHKGQLCAKIDPAPYQAIVDEDTGLLAAAKSQLAKDQANLVYARISHQRADLLWTEDSISHDAVDAALNAYNQALAQVRLDTAQVADETAVLRAGKINLNYTNIISPVDGTVVSRNVTAGQTVAASFQTPTLFLIATDLTKMQVDTNVSESDIASAVQGAHATFTVDAFPKLTFQGVATQVRQAPISVQNVITYDVVITVANPDLLLKPGMTATAKIDAARAVGVLRVPSQALRFTPTGPAKTANASGRGVWALRDGKLVRIAVTVGLDDDRYAEIKSGDLKVGDQVVTSEVAPGKPAKSQPAPALHL